MGVVLPPALSRTVCFEDSGGSEFTRPKPKNSLLILAVLGEMLNQN
jgi:hypothetical protein